MDLPTLEALNAEWRRHPPVHHLVAAYLDYKPADQPGAPMSKEQEAELQKLVQASPQISGAPALDTSAWDAFVNKDGGK